MSRVTELHAVDDLEEQLSHPDALYEVVDGQIEEKLEMGTFATHVASQLLVEILLFVRTHRLGRTEMGMLHTLDPSRPLKRRPDLSFVSYGRWPSSKPVPDDGGWEVVPDLAVEVISRNETDRKIQKKLREYSHAGVRQVWLVRPLDETVSVYRSPRDVTIYGAKEELDGGDVLPGFRLPLAPLFRTTDE